MNETPSSAEIKRSINVINDMAIICAFRNIYTEPVPELIKVMKFLESMVKHA